MNIICHRRNTIEELKKTPSCFGVEMDIHSFGRNLVVQHDPFRRGPLLEDWLRHYSHGTLILNVKEEGLEEHVLEHVRRHGIEDFFFLDQSFPFLLKTARQGERRCAVRISEYESADTALRIASMVDWVWVDCFTRFPLNGQQARRLQRAGLRLCLVSPELQGRDGRAEIPRLRQLLQTEGIQADAVCTKFQDLWG